MRPISATTSSGVLRRLARLWAWLADSGTSSACAATSMARSAPFRLGTSTDGSKSGKVFAKVTSSAVSASLRHQLGRHEGADLEFAQPGRVCGADPLELARGGQHARQDL